MIRLHGMKVNIDELQLTKTQAEVYHAMDVSTQYFNYFTLNELKFEILVRDKIISTALLMNGSGIIFAPFKYSAFNDDFWIRTKNGYLIKNSVLPSDAINDIFLNGKKYRFECSTAIIIIYYKALLESIDKNMFNYLFQNLFVWNWNYDKDLVIITQIGNEFIPADVVYFYNPDYDNPVWAGENAVFLGNDKYFGHGIGIKSSNEMINELNKLRKKDATKSAFLLSQHSRLDLKNYTQFAKN